MASINNVSCDEPKSLQKDLKSGLKSSMKPSQRCASLKLVVLDLQQKLTVYKNRCVGMDSLSLMLKEAKQEVVKLKKHSKALETALTNLQNRLAAHGLSSSVSIQETELYIPGASFQTLDNLAKENARLRNLLKNGEGHQTEKIPNEDNAHLEDLEAENNQLKAQLLDLQGIKMDYVAKFNKEIEKKELKEENLRVELRQLEEKMKKLEAVKGVIKDVSEQRQPDTEAGQIANMEKVDELRTLLKLTAEKCSSLDKKLPIMQEQESLNLQTNLEEVILINKRWKEHSTNQEQRIHTLTARVQELDNPEHFQMQLKDSAEAHKKEFARLRGEIEVRNNEIKEQKNCILILTQQLQSQKSQPQAPQVDMSIVEILKQQIQVCTEDFDTERKDREQAVSKVKELQAEVIRLKKENDMFKKEITIMREQKTLEMQSKLAARSPQTPDLGQMSAQSGRLFNPSMQPHYRHPNISASRSTPSSSGVSSLAPNFSMNTTPVLASSERQFNAETGHVPFRGQDFNSLPRPVYDRPSAVYSDSVIGISMPAMARSGSVPLLGTGSRMSCPKCNKIFPDSQQNELLQHLSTCND